MIVSLDALVRYRPPAGVKVISFDVFDTLIIRKLDPPENLKRIAAQHAVRCLGLSISGEELLAGRMNVEANLCCAARQAGGDAEFSVAEVYGRLCADVPQLRNMADRLTAAELEVEMAYAAAMPSIAGYLAELSRDYRLIAISDTYLPGACLEKLLEQCGLSKYFGKVYASCDYGCNKGSGRLFGTVMALEHCSPPELLHVGDNILSDYVRPRTLGVKSLLLMDNRHLERKAQLAVLGQFAEESRQWKGLATLDGITSAPHGSHYCKKPENLHEWGRSVVGPLVTLFIHELCLQLRNSPVDRVYFLAREGFLLKKLYERFNRELFGGVLPRGVYLCVSRSTAFLASLADLVEQEMNLLLHDFSLDLRDVLRRLGIEDDAEIARIAETYGTVPSLSDKGRIRTVLMGLKADHGCWEAVKNRSLEMREKLSGYLAETGYFSAGRLALVDIGWYGSIQDCLEKAFPEQHDPRRIHGYYLGLDYKRDGSYGAKTGLLHDFRAPSIDGIALTYFRLAFEFSCRAGHGTTTGYMDKGSRWHPEFRANARESECFGYIRVIQQGITAFAGEYISIASVEWLQPDLLKPAFLAGYNRRISFPDRSMVESFAPIINSDDYASEKCRHITGEIRLSDLLSPIGLCRKFIETPWREAALARLRIPLSLTCYYLIKRCMAYQRVKAGSPDVKPASTPPGAVRDGGALPRIQFVLRLWHRRLVVEVMKSLFRSLSLLPARVSLLVLMKLIQLKRWV